MFIKIKNDDEKEVDCRCIANINGICKARECKGEIRRLTDCETNPTRRRGDMICRKNLLRIISRGITKTRIRRN